MSFITNSKIGFTRYTGFSILFDNPGKDNTVPMWKGSDLQRICCQADNTNLELYTKLNDGLTKIDLENSFTEYFFFKLPFYSYHVTVWDGLNDGNKNKISLHYQDEVDEFLQKLSCSMERNNKFTKIVESSNLVTKKREITFRFKKLTIWGNSVLVARLEPTDDTSNQVIEKIKSDRIELYYKYEKEFGLDRKAWRSGYDPHITLGYFGNERAGKAALAQLDSWTNVFLELTGDITIHFSSASVYGFTDMQTFFRKI